jgi:hypothetical protein
VRLPATLRVDVSDDGDTWRVVHDERPGGLALRGALELPRVVPVVADLKDSYGRYLRVNLTRFRPEVIRIYTP